MKTSAWRRQLSGWTIGATLVVLAAASYWWLLGSQEAAATASDNLAACLRFTAEIKKLRERPLRAGSEIRSATELAHLIETSVQKASLPAASLVQIDPQPARRLGNSAYKEQPTHVELRDVTSKQLVILLHSLTAGESGAELAELRLSAPRDESADVAKEETWTAEITLTHLIFAP